MTPAWLRTTRFRHPSQGTDDMIDKDEAVSNLAQSLRDVLTTVFPLDDTALVSGRMEDGRLLTNILLQRPPKREESMRLLVERALKGIDLRLTLNGDRDWADDGPRAKLTRYHAPGTVVATWILALDLPLNVLRYRLLELHDESATADDDGGPEPIYEALLEALKKDPSSPMEPVFEDSVETTARDLFAEHVAEKRAEKIVREYEEPAARDEAIAVTDEDKWPSPLDIPAGDEDDMSGHLRQLDTVEEAVEEGKAIAKDMQRINRRVDKVDKAVEDIKQAVTEVLDLLRRPETVRDSRSGTNGRIR